MRLDDAPEDSLRADLEAAFDAPDPAGDIATIPDKEVVADAAGKTGAPDAAVSTAEGERARGPDGKFIPKDSKTDAVPAKAAPDQKSAAPKVADTKQPSTDTATKASEAQPSTAANAPPVGWTADAKAEWDSLSPAIKAAVLKREVEISSGGRQWSDEKRRYEEIVAPVRQAASRRGITEAEGIQRLMAAQDRLDRNPAEAIQWLAGAYNVPITVNGQQPNGSQPADGSSRTESAFDPRTLSPLLSPIQQQLAAIQARFAADDQRQTDMTLQRVQAFAADPAHAHFDAVSDELMAMLPILKGQNPHATPEQLLQDAYDRAVYANPGTRAAVEAQRVADADAKRRADNSAAVNKAKLAASSIRGTPPTGLPNGGAKDSIREELEAAFAARG